MPDTETKIDVLIVGAGPVGLFLANECARRGLRCRILETRASQSEHSKALAIFPRTLEIFDMAGVVDGFLEKANRVTSVAIMTSGRTLADLRFEPENSPYSFVAMVPQDVTETLLVDELRRKGGVVEYETTFVSADRRNEGVVVTADHKGDTIRVNASFVVGCDGARSNVRKALNLPLEGGEYPDEFLLADVETNDSLPGNQLQLCPSEAGPVAIFPMSATHRRIVATIDLPEGDAPSLELVRKILKERGPGGVEPRSIGWSSYFRIHHRRAAELRKGRVFIAGDAAHLHSPFGGQGMNTGLQDVWNLAWKLDLYLRGHGNDELLDSYAAERLPVIRQVIDTTDFLTKALGTPNKLAQILRNAVIPMVSGLAPVQHAFVERLSELGIAYRGSPIVEGPGRRYFEDSMRGGKGIGSRFLMLIDDDQEAAVREAQKQLASFGDVVEIRQSPHKGVKLVRPDGYLAYQTDTGTIDSALTHVRRLLQRQTSQPAPVM
ncbi:MAG TPA: FAD-dependent monooxygenase [Bryobacteraceae bacterium]|nr:FAD-dependent monooxygenase [Bryobacteraceae bacterium]